MSGKDLKYKNKDVTYTQNFEPLRDDTNNCGNKS